MPKIKNHAPEEYYHIYNRGMQKQPIFENDKDRLRFLFLLFVFQGKNSIKNISREIKQNVQSSTLHIKPELEKEILKNRTVELINFCLMPNHFHLQVSYKSVWMRDDTQLMHVSAYIHKNSGELLGWKGKEDRYPWSSFQDYIYTNRWNKLLSVDFILDHYIGNNKAISYKDFIKTS